MKISTRARYGIRALLDLALHHEQEPILLKDIAERQEISLHYLEHLMASLVAGGIIRSTRGARGGISLVKSPRDIKVSEVIRLYEGSTAPVECVGKPEVCRRSKACVTRELWSDVKEAIDGVLDGVTIQDLATRQQAMEKSEAKMYYI